MPVSSHRSTSPMNQPRVLTISHLTQIIKSTIEQTVPAVWVTGEVGDLSRPRSGHFYFSLKDSDAQIRAVVWRSTANRLDLDFMRDGVTVVARGDLEVYAPRGTYQIVLRHVEPLGVGELQLALRRLQKKLAEEGLFDAEHKQPLPKFPKRIAVVTSPTGAAVRDFLEVVRRRWRGLGVSIIPSRVQGDGAAQELARAIRAANRLTPRPDVLVVTRGGGSIEDLWSFNEEVVVRAIFQSEIPVVSAVGHEIDVTLSDLVADVRALTPTEAAERVAPSSEELAQWIGSLEQRLSAALDNQASSARLRLDALANSRTLSQPLDLVHVRSRRLDELNDRLQQAAARGLKAGHERIGRFAGQLESLSPLAVLGRGYSLTTDSDGGLVTSHTEVAAGDRLMTRLQRGMIESEVLGCRGEQTPDNGDGKSQ